MAQPITTLAAHPELEAQLPQLHEASWPSFIQADPVARRYWGELFATFPEYQYLLCEDGQLIAAGHAIPLVWDGTIAGLPAGWDAALEWGFRAATEGLLPNALCGLSIVILPNTQGKGLSEQMVSFMKTLALADGLPELIIPVRPSRKSEHPAVPIAEYLTWTQPNGESFDPWLRIHQRLGAQVLSIAPRSMVIPGTVAEWEAWAHQSFPASGRYPVAGALDLVEIDRERDQGLYEEPNVWVRYPVHGAS
jgi:GNAT superfamily N-acetyltransferase